MIHQEPLWDKIYKSGVTWKKETKFLPNLLGGKSVLELGVGNGKTLQSIVKQNPKSITAVDFSQEAITLAKKSIKSEKITFLKSDITNLPFKEEFDIIICYYVLNNLLENKRKQAILSMKSSLKKGGIILFEDFAVGDFREKEYSKRIEQNTIEKKNGIICHFLEKGELISLFKDFKEIKISTKTFNPLRVDKNKKRKIIGAIIKK